RKFLGPKRTAKRPSPSALLKMGRAHCTWGMGRAHCTKLNGPSPAPQVQTHLCKASLRKKRMAQKANGALAQEQMGLLRQDWSLQAKADPSCVDLLHS